MIQSLILLLVFQSIILWLEATLSNYQKIDHPRKRVISIQNVDDNECLKSSIVRYLNPADGNPARITKADKKACQNLPKSLILKI